MLFGHSAGVVLLIVVSDVRPRFVVLGFVAELGARCGGPMSLIVETWILFHGNIAHFHNANV